MFNRLLQKAKHHPQLNLHVSLTLKDFDCQLGVHYGIPSTSVILAFDPIQSLLAIGTLDGRIKVIGGDNIEGLLISPRQSPYKFLEFLQNQGFLVSVSNDNHIQVWDLESRSIAGSLQWDSNITAFSVIYASHFMYVGDECGVMSVLKYDTKVAKLLLLPYRISADYVREAIGLSVSYQLTVVGVLPQPCSLGKSVLIAYENGLLILWDVVEARIVVVRGNNVLELKEGNHSGEACNDIQDQDDASEDLLEVKEISSLCWASSSGTILAVGYMDGDILFWRTSSDSSNKSKHSGLSCNNVVKLQLSSAKSRLPVVTLHWSASSKCRNDCDGQLFIYGGCEIGSKEVLTVLSLEWSSGMETIKCGGRVDLALNAPFADMILLPPAGTAGKNHNAALFLLTSPAELQYYCDTSLLALVSHQEKKLSSCIVESSYSMLVPTANPFMTVAQLSNLTLEDSASNVLRKAPTLSEGGRWPLTGGISNNLFAKNKEAERVYVAGYQDGSVRMWDATYPVLSLICVLKSEIKGLEVAGSSAPVSQIDVCSRTLSLAVGNECGLVRLYNFNHTSDDKGFHLITETENTVHPFSQEKGPCCRAVVCLHNSSVQALKFTSSGLKLAVGYHSGRVAVIDTKSISLLFFTECVSSPSAPVISVTWGSSLHAGHIRSPINSKSEDHNKFNEDLIFILTENATACVIDGGNGSMIGSRTLHLRKEATGISMYVIAPGLPDDMEPRQSPKDSAPQDATNSGGKSEHHSSQDSQSKGSSKDSLVLLCCKNTLHLYPLKSLVHGDKKYLLKVRLAKPCHWATILRKADGDCGLFLLYETGIIEIRSLPDLELVKESSLQSILRWNFKENMEKTMSSTDNGLIAMANGSELAVISFLTSDSNFRNPDFLPSLHDKVLAAAAETAISYSLNQKKKQGTSSSILGGMVKSIKKGKVNHSNESSIISGSHYGHLEDIFSRDTFQDSSASTADKQKQTELSIDDIEIDEPVPMVSNSSQISQTDQRGMNSERKKLFEGKDDIVKPRLRTPEEIMATYRKTGDASSVASQARNKLIERQERLERMSQRTEELRNGAEDFASLANELVKAMESRKWWHI